MLDALISVDRAIDKCDIEYKKRVRKLLKQKVEIDNKTAIVRECYRFPDPETDKVYYLDLVILNQEMEIISIYVICSLSAYERNLKFLQQQLLFYKKITNVEKLFLSYIDNDGDLKIVLFSEISKAIKENKKKNSAIPKTIDNISDYVEFIKESCNDKEGELRFFFRGHSDRRYKTIPGVYRNDKNIIYEKHLYHEAIRRMPEEFAEEMSTFDNLVKMQHYGLPTRLLDITANPLVALFFACQENNDVDGEVLMYSMLPDQIKYFDSEPICVLANLAKRPITFHSDCENEYPYFIKDIKKDRPTFNGEIKGNDDLHQVFCVLPKLSNERIIKQEGAFFIFGMKETKVKPASLPDPPSRIGIKANAKKEILRDLELFGINEASLFPEIDKIMKQIKQEICGL